VNRDDEDAALAHQQELEQRRQEEDRLLAADPDYAKWLDQLNDKLNQQERKQ